MNPAQSRGHRPDYVLALVTFILLVIGMIMMYSMSPVLSHKLLGNAGRNYYFYGQLVNIAVGLVVWIAAFTVHYTRWKSWAKPLMILAAVTSVALLIPGLSFTKNGATRWLKLGPLSFQPAELLKLAMVCYLAVWLEKRQEELKSFWDGLVPFSVMVGAFSFVVVVLQRDMGTMMILAMAAVGMYFAAGARWRHLAALGLGGAGFLAVTIAAFPHRMQRLMTFLNPESDPTGSGYHISQALIAIGSGGIFGVGLGKSIQVYGYLPEAANDSIFAIIAEEFGMLGSLGVIGLFGLLVYRGLKVAHDSPDEYSRYLAVGASMWLLFQALINIAAMLSLVPLTGVPLPFISYGGSSLVFSLIAAGILMNISKYTIKEVKYENTGERRRHGWSYIANSGNARRVKAAR